MNLLTVKVEKPESVNFILGQTHFIKTVEDIHEAIVGAVPDIWFGLAFCESSGPALVRRSGNDGPDRARHPQCPSVGAGQSFFVFLENGFPLNVLNAIKAVPEVCRIYCATANPVEVVVAESGEGRAILGVVDGRSPKGVESEQDVLTRLRSCGRSATSSGSSLCQV